jgi:hypothetical protein
MSTKDKYVAQKKRSKKWSDNNKELYKAISKNQKFKSNTWG